MSEINSKPTFCTLPYEIRLQIYDLLLVPRQTNRKVVPSWVREELGIRPRRFIVDDPSFTKTHRRSVNPSIVQTCRQINHEARHILYSHNVFGFFEPKTATLFFQQIGPVNFELLRSLHFSVGYNPAVDPWLDLFDVLARKATRIRVIAIEWRWSQNLGNKLNFVHALAMIQGVEEFVITGNYAKQWLAYLESTTKAQVRNSAGNSPRKSCHSDYTGEHKDSQELGSFLRYQEGMEYFES